MANSSLITGDVFYNDNFLGLSQGSKILYCYCLLASDNEGFFTGKNMLLKMSGATDYDFEELVKNNYILKGEDDFVIKGWFILNKMRMTQIAKSKHMTLRQRLFLKPNGSYTFEDKENSIWYPLFFEIAKRVQIPKGETMIAFTFKTIYQNKQLSDLNERMINSGSNYLNIDSNLVIATIDSSKLNI